VFDIFIKKKKVVVDAFTDDAQAFAAKISPATKYFPEWWKKTDSIVSYSEKHHVTCPTGKTKTIRSCPGIIELYKRSFVQPSWFEFELDILPDASYFYRSSTSNDYFHSHFQIQFDKFVPVTEGANLKICSPWVLRTKKDAFFNVFEPTWDTLPRFSHFSLLPGIMNAKYTSSFNLNYIIRYIEKEQNPKYISIMPFEPIAMMLPLDDVEIEFNHVFVSEAEKYKMFRPIDMTLQSLQSRFNRRNVYSKSQKYIDKMNELNDE